MFPQSLAIYATCPGWGDSPTAAYRSRAIAAARWSDELGCRGLLIFTDNGAADPWAVAQLVIENTRRLTPLVAVQPVYMHPYTVAKKVATLACIYGRAVALNLVAGGFRNDLAALNDPTPHDERYARLVEYATIVRALLAGAGPVTFAGVAFKVTNLRLTPPLPPELFPVLMCSGSSEAGLAAARALNAVAVCYPGPLSDYSDPPRADAPEYGVRVGVVARANESEAWRAARERFPEDRRGQIAHALAMKTSDSSWHRQLSDMAATPLPDGPYWLHPFRNYKGFCPYLVGSYERVGAEIAGYVRAGFRTFILDVPPDRDELEHAARAFACAERSPPP